jgi:hypothetical protein
MRTLGQLGFHARDSRPRMNVCCRATRLDSARVFRGHGFDRRKAMETSDQKSIRSMRDRHAASVPSGQERLAQEWASVRRLIAFSALNAPRFSELHSAWGSLTREGFFVKRAARRFFELLRPVLFSWWKSPSPAVGAIYIDQTLLAFGFSGK